MAVCEEKMGDKERGGKKGGTFEGRYQ